MMKKRFIRWLLAGLFTLPMHVGAAFAVEIAPRISDREIIEGLARLDERLTHLETGQQTMQKQLEQRMDTIQKQLEQRMDAMQEQFEQRMDAMQKHTEQRMDAMQEQFEQRMDGMQKQTEQRFISLEERMSDRMDAQWTLTLVLIAAIFGLIGFVVWDRKTALKPLERRVAGVADDLERDLELRSPDGSIVTRLMDALREVASEDQRLADALQRHALPRHAPQRV